MEPVFLGLPLTTLVVVGGVPVIIIALLIWWGISYRVPADDANDAAKRRKA